MKQTLKIIGWVLLTAAFAIVGGIIALMGAVLVGAGIILLGIFAYGWDWLHKFSPFLKDSTETKPLGNEENPD